MLGTVYRIRKLNIHAASFQFHRTVGLHSVKIYGLPSDTESGMPYLPFQNLLEDYFKLRYGEKIREVHLAPKLWYLSQLIDEYESTQSRLIVAEEKAQRDGFSNLVLGLRSQLRTLRSQITEEQAKPLVSSGVAYVTFYNYEDAGQCVKELACPEDEHSRQTRIYLDLCGPQWKIERAPEPEDIIWVNQGNDFCQRFLRVSFLNGCLLLLVMVFVTPQAVGDTIKDWATENAPVLSALAFFIPILVLMVFLWAIVPIVLQYIAKFEGQQLRSDMEDFFIQKYFAYLFVAAVVLQLTSWQFKDLVNQLQTASQCAGVAGCFTNATLSVVFAESERHDPKKMAGLNFVRYIMTWTLISTPLELYRVPQRFANLFARGWRAALCDEAGIEPFDFAMQYALLLHVISIVFFFASIAPVVLIFGTAYFAFKHVVDRFLLICIHPASTRLGVRQATTALSIFVVCILLFLFGTASFLVAQSGGVTGGPSDFITIIFIIAFFFYIVMQCYLKTAKSIKKRSQVPSHLRNLMDGAWFDKSYVLSPRMITDNMMDAHTPRQHDDPDKKIRGTCKMAGDFSDVAPQSPMPEMLEEEMAEEICSIVPSHGRLATKDGTFSTDEAETFRNAYRHPALQVYHDGLEILSPTKTDEGAEQNSASVMAAMGVDMSEDFTVKGNA